MICCDFSLQWIIIDGRKRMDSAEAVLEPGRCIRGRVQNRSRPKRLAGEKFFPFAQGGRQRRPLQVYRFLRQLSQSVELMLDDDGAD
jgi:hypothetical protein